MRMTYKVTYDGGKEVTATAKPIDIMEYERRYGVSFMQFGEGTPMEHAWFLAWAPLHRTGQDPREFDAFMTDVESITVVEEKPAVPTRRGRSGGSSPASQPTSE